MDVAFKVPGPMTARRRNISRYQSLIDCRDATAHALSPYHYTREPAICGCAPGVGMTEHQAPNNGRPLVAVVDDSDSVRESLPDLLQQVGFDVEAFASAEAFLASSILGKTSCLILDVGLPGMSGPELQQELKRRASAIPIVFITAQGDKSLAPRLVAAGATACLFKPFSDAALIDAVEAALDKR